MLPTRSSPVISTGRIETVKGTEYSLICSLGLLQAVGHEDNFERFIADNEPIYDSFNKQNDTNECTTRCNTVIGKGRCAKPGIGWGEYMGVQNRMFQIHLRPRRQPMFVFELG